MFSSSVFDHDVSAAEISFYAFINLTTRPRHSLADDKLSQVRLREASQLLQCVVLWHRQAGDVWRQLGERNAEGVGRHVALLQAQHHTQDVGHTLRHFCVEEEEGQGC